MMKYDPEQQQVITAEGGHFLVLAPPGCGKTQTLAERIFHAHSNGVPYDRMLCLTFTNRASRGMRDRIRLKAAALPAGTDSIDSLFVGNIHRFCSRFLLDEDNAVIHPDSSILDDNDIQDILDSFGAKKDASVYRLTRNDPNPLEIQSSIYIQINRIQHYIQQVLHGHSADILFHDMGDVFRKYFEMFGIRYRPARLAQCLQDILLKVGADSWQDAKAGIFKWIETSPFEYHSPCYCLFSVALVDAMLYGTHKAANRMVDFDDILVLTYDALSEPDARQKYKYAAYPWIQIDEVQDLNALQLAIIDRITAPGATVVYLGDEQQAIFSFMGAKLDSLNILMERCGSQVIRLRMNHRSPKYLLDVCNTFASSQLCIKPEFLPEADDNVPPQPNDLVLREYDFYSQNTTLGNPIPEAKDKKAELEQLPAAINYYLAKDPSESLAVVVGTNNEADEISRKLSESEIPHFKISGQDVFKGDDFKTLLAHFIVTLRETSQIDWARLFFAAGAVRSFTDARAFVRRMQDLALSPADLIERPGSSYLQDFVHMYDAAGGLVIFDTETTGLDVWQDDIVQIAAIKIRDGRIVDELNLILQTDRQIPPMLGDIPNPLVEEYASRDKLSRPEGIRRFFEWIGDMPLLGHNVNYDYEILRHNFERLRQELPTLDFHARLPLSKVWDSLRLIRILEPRLKVYKLKVLLERLKLEGTNSHLANDDIVATFSLVSWCRRRAEDFLDKQQQFLSDPGTLSVIGPFFRMYAPIRQHTRDAFDQVNADDGTTALAVEIQSVYNTMLEQEIIHPIPRIDYILRFIDHTVAQSPEFSHLSQQMDRWMNDIRTFTEADLCESDIIDDRVYVLTVHKAKGLEFDTVIVWDVVDGKYPFFASVSDSQKLEDARKLYVALSRAKRRLIIMYGKRWVWEGQTARGTSTMARTRQLSPFLNCIRPFFRNK